MELQGFVVVLLVAAFTGAEKFRYDNFKLYSVKVENEEQLQMMQEMEGNTVGYRMLTHPSKINKDVSILVSPELMKNFTKMVDDEKLQARVLFNNFQELIDKEQSPRRANAGFDWTSYHTIDEISAWLDEIVLTRSEIASTVIGGKSHEGRPIKGVHIVFNENNPNVVLEANIHAREWITSATATWFINYLLTEKSLGVLADFNWYIFPVVNPDGFAYTHSHDRLWRKTRKRSLLCYGADPNRNWDHAFMFVGANNNPCSDIYAGSAPFSEIETKTLSEFFKTIPNLQVYLDFHSFGQMLMFPYGNTTDHLDNYDEASEIAKKAVDKLRERYGTEYIFGNIAETIYPASGGSIDWVKNELKPRISFVYELRDNGAYGFVLPADQIIPTAEETMDSVIVILTEVKKLN